MQIQDRRTRVQSNQDVIRGRGVAKHDYGRTVEQHVRQAFGRVSRIERHICAARLERRQHADQQFGTAPRIQCDAIAPTHASSTQIVGQAVRTPIEFRVGQSTLVLNHRNRVRRARGLPFEQFVQAEPRWTCLFAGIPTTNDFFTLHFRQDVQLPQRPVRIALQRIDQPCQRDLEEIANARRIDACSRLRTNLEIVAVIVDVHADGVVGSLVPVEQFDAVGNMRGRDLRLAVPIVQQRREQRRLRRHPAATLRQHQRRMLVTHQFRQLRMRLLHTRLHARLRYPHPHRQRVDEQAQRSIRLRASLHPPEQHRAEHHVLPPRRARQHQPPRHMHHARRAHPQPARMSAKRPRQLRLQPPRRLRYLTPVSLNAQQTERRRRLIDVPQLRPEVRFVVRLAHPQPRLRDEIPERLRPRQVLRSALPDRARLLDHTLERRMIDRQMVKQHARHPAFVLAVASRVNVHQRRAAHVHPIAARIEAGLQLPHDVAFARIELDDANRQRRPALHDLHRLLESLPEKAGAQDVVPIDHLLQCRHKPLHHLAAAERQHARQHVRIAFPRHQVMKQNAFLQRRQRIDVLHVRRSAFHLRHQRVDRLLAQRHQRQLGRRNVLVAVGNQIRRYPDVLIVGPQMRGEIGQRRRPVDDTHVGMQARRPKLLAQADHEQ
ncbi:Uncharacterised protein [Burkholderia pseudomallei]|nr:Uncharacterised protein [Burkholderia pseudomallei]